jgi:hypothetical protein
MVSAANSVKMSDLSTGVIFDPRMVEHNCLWETHAERPERFSSVMQRQGKFHFFQKYCGLYV